MDTTTLLETNLATLYPTRIANALEEAGFFKVKDLQGAVDADLLSIENFGVSYLHTVKRGLSLLIKSELSPPEIYDILLENRDIQRPPEPEFLPGFLDPNRKTRLNTPKERSLE